ncbi:MAG: nitrilase family protein [Ekhidna sp.]
MKDLTISLIQADLYWEQIEANLAMFEEKIWSIAEEVDLIILPEMFTTGFSMNAEALAEPPGGKTYKWMRQMAGQKKAAIVGSCIIKEGGEFYNRLYFVYPDGSSEQYDKKHLFTLAGEHISYTPGNLRLTLAYKGWKINTLICYDLRFPVWGRSAKQESTPYEYDLQLYVANWPSPRVDAWDTLLKARAIENLAYVAGVNRVGKDGTDKDYVGHSAVYAYDGQSLTFSESEEVLTVTLRAEELKQYRDRFRFQEDADSFEIN